MIIINTEIQLAEKIRFLVRTVID